MAAQTQSGSAGAATATPAAPPTKGTITTPQGPITWEKTSDGTVTALGNGQKFTSHGTEQSNGSWAQQANYAKTGQTSYLAMASTGDAAGRKVQFLMSAGSSRLTLTVSDIDAGVTSGTATLSGSWNGAVVQWTGHADLTSNPFVSRPIAGWPKGAFATELQMAAFFAPLGNVLAQAVIAPPAATPNGTTLQPRSVMGTIGRAGAWCLGGAIAGSAAGPETLGISVLLGCAGGAVASLGNDIVTWADDDLPTGEPPVITLPPDPEPTGPVTTTQPDGPPDTGGDGSGSQSSSGSDGGGDEGDGGDEGGDGGGGSGIDDKPPHQPD